MAMVVIGPRGSVELAVQSLKDGASDFLEVTVGKEALNLAVEVAQARDIDPRAMAQAGG
jgi:FixJ family two-component response regulator